MDFLQTRMPPSLWYTIALMIGIALAPQVDGAHALVLACLAIFGVLWSSLWFEQQCHHAARLIAVVCVGYALMGMQQTAYTTLLDNYSNRTVSCSGTVQEYTYMAGSAMRHRITCSIKKILTDDSPVWHTVSNPLIMINSTANYSHLIGSEIQINDIKISAPKGDFRRFCVRRNILASLYIPKLSITMLNRPTYSLSRFLSRVQQKLITIFKRHLSRPTFTLFSAIFLGHTEAIKKDLKQYHGVFQRWGIVHYLARSGLHLVLVTIMLEYALSYIPLSFLVRRILIIGSASLYWLCTWSSVSFYRALALFFMVNTLLIARRPFHFLHLLFSLCALFLILNPSHLFFLDFQLTFGLTAILALFNSSTARHW